MAGVMVFHPEPAQLRTLVGRLREQGVDVTLFLNSAISDTLRRDLTVPGVSILEAESNLGVGAALNLLGLEACLRDNAAIMFFDQDSVVPSNLAARLVAAWTHLQSAGKRPAVVSPLLVSKAGTNSKAPTYRFLDDPDTGPMRRVAFVPTSGSLIATDVLRRTGFFRTDFFIDGIDLEWSFRAASLGYSCWIDAECEMPHAVGAGVIGWRWLRWRMPKQRPMRMYCLIRNTLYCLRLRHIPLEWRLKQLAYLPIQAGTFALHHNLRWPVVKLLLLGIADGLAGRLGPPRIWPAGHREI